MHAKSILTIITTVAVFGTSVIAAPVADSVELAEREFNDSLDLVERDYLDSAIDLEARSVFDTEDLDARDLEALEYEARELGDLAELEAREFEEIDARQLSPPASPRTPFSPTGSLMSGPPSPMSPMSPGLGRKFNRKQRKALRRLMQLREAGPPTDKKELAAYRKRAAKLREAAGLPPRQKLGRRARRTERRAAAAAAAQQSPGPAASTQKLQARSFSFWDNFKGKPKGDLTDAQKNRMTNMRKACDATKNKKRRNGCKDDVRRLELLLRERAGFINRIRSTSGKKDL